MKWNIVGKLLCSFYLLCIAVTTARGQEKAVIRGKVKDAATKKPLPEATVVVVLLKNNSILSQAITNEQGAFLLQYIPIKDSLLIYISYMGYAPLTKIVSLTEPRYDLGETELIPASKSLDTLQVTAQKPAITVKQDTVEFRASAFKVQPNNAIEDLFKKIPGLVMDAEGNLTFNGKKISRILVDGQEFFSANSKIAIKNLPANLVDKIQVTDTKNLQQAFSGMPTAEQDQTLNIKLKKEKNINGNIAAGAGSDKRYEAAAMFNYFEGPQKITFLAGANNVNKSDFTVQPGAESISLYEQGNGIITSRTGGVNFSDEKGKLKYNGSYQYNHAFTDRSSLKERKQYMVPDSSFFTTNNNKAEDKTGNHQLDFQLEYVPDSTSTIVIHPDFSHKKTRVLNTNALITSTNKGVLVNSGENALSTEGNSNYIGAEFFWGKRFNQTGRQLSVSFKPAYNSSRTTNRNKVRNTFYMFNGTQIMDQTIHTLVDNTQYDCAVTYTMPVSKSWKLTLEESLSAINQHMDRKLYNLDSTDNAPVLDSFFSANYRTNIFSNTTKALFNFTEGKWKGFAGVYTAYTRQHSQIFISKNLINQKQFYCSPILFIKYSIANNKDISLYYSAQAQLPSLEQLQPVVDNTNPLLIRKGNPDLKPFLSSLYLAGYSVINTAKNIIGSARIFYLPQKNTIVNSITYDSLGRQQSQYVNVNGVYTGNLMFTLNKSWRTLHSQKGIGIELSANERRSVTFVNSVQTFLQNHQWSAFLTLQYSHDTILDCNASYRFAYNRLYYSTHTWTAQDYSQHSCQAALKVSWPKDFQVVTNFLYNYNTQAPPGFKKHTLLWNINASYSLLKQKQGLIRFTVYDLLKQNNNIRRTTADNYIEDSQAAVLQQYWLLSFIYRINVTRK